MQQVRLALAALSVLLVVFSAVAAAAAAKTSRKVGQQPLKKTVGSDVVGSGSSGSGSSSGGGGSNAVAYYVLAVQRCHSGASWTIHGLWPQYTANTWPSNCNSSAPYDPSLINDLVGALRQSWPNCRDASDNRFLAHEWVKHGTCSGLGEHGYFSTALQIFQAGAWRSQCEGSSSRNCHVPMNL